MEFYTDRKCKYLFNVAMEIRNVSTGNGFSGNIYFLLFTMTTNFSNHVDFLYKKVAMAT